MTANLLKLKRQQFFTCPNSASAESILTLKNRESIHFVYFLDRLSEKNRFIIHELIHVLIHVSLLYYYVIKHDISCIMIHNSLFIRIDSVLVKTIMVFSCGSMVLSNSVRAGSVNINKNNVFKQYS